MRHRPESGSEACPGLNPGMARTEEAPKFALAIPFKLLFRAEKVALTGPVDSSAARTYESVGRVFEPPRAHHILLVL